MCMPINLHWEAALYVLRYLKGSLHQRLCFPVTSDLYLTAYCDFDRASCSYSRKSLSGYCIFLESCLISQKTKKRTTISKSSNKEEYRAMVNIVFELFWINYIFQDLQVSVQLPISLYYDSNAAMHIATNPIFHKRIKHIEIDCHIVRDQFQQGFILSNHLST